MSSGSPQRPAGMRGRMAGWRTGSAQGAMLSGAAGPFVGHGFRQPRHAAFGRGVLQRPPPILNQANTTNPWRAGLTGLPLRCAILQEAVRRTDATMLMDGEVQTRKGKGQNRGASARRFAVRDSGHRRHVPGDVHPLLRNEKCERIIVRPTRCAGWRSSPARS